MDGYPALIRVRMPDRPGALGLVASRIGALKADIVGIEILGRGDGDAFDEIAVVLPDPDLVTVLTREIEEVDGVAVEAIELAGELPEPRLDTLHAALRITAARDDAALATALAAALVWLPSDWCAIGVGGATVVAGDAPRPELHEAAGSRATRITALEPLATLSRDVGPAIVLVGRARAPHAAELARIDGYCALAAGVWERGVRLR